MITYKLHCLGCDQVLFKWERNGDTDQTFHGVAGEPCDTCKSQFQKKNPVQVTYLRLASPTDDGMEIDDVEAYIQGEKNKRRGNGGNQQLRKPTHAA